MKVYFDTNCIIYLVERHPKREAPVIVRIIKLRAVGDELVVGDVSRTECLVGPFKRGDTSLEQVLIRCSDAPVESRQWFGVRRLDAALLRRGLTRRPASQHVFGQGTATPSGVARGVEPPRGKAASSRRTPNRGLTRYVVSETALAARYQAFFADPDVKSLPLTTPAYERAAWIRAKYAGIKLPDALHLATAIEHGCGSFVTADAQLAVCKEVDVEVLK